jgi:uncharacterized membrane protein YkvA (DUF1232 family)
MGLIGRSQERNMTLKFEVELTDEDLDYYRNLMDQAWQRNAQRDQKDVVASARRLLATSAKTEAPAYVKKRLDDLDVLISMLEDPEWPLEPKDQQRILAAASFFADPVDMIPDQIPGLGFLDDALMAELVIRELEHELDGYREFSEFREKQEAVRGKEAHVTRQDWLAEKRRQIRFHIARRREEARRHWSGDSPTDPVLGFLSDRY